MVYAWLWRATEASGVLLREIAGCGSDSQQNRALASRRGRVVVRGCNLVRIAVGLVGLFDKVLYMFIGRAVIEFTFQVVIINK